METPSGSTLSLSHASAFDEVSLDQLRDGGGLKWSTFPELIGAFVAEMDFGTAPPVVAALHEAVDAGVLGYLPGDLTDRMAAAYAAWAASRYGWDVRPAWVRPLGDVMAGLQATIEHFSAPGSAVIVPTPAYMPFLTVPETMGREQVEVPMAVETGADGRSRHVYDLDALDAAFAAGAGVLVLCNPHNPIGRVLERAEMLAVAEVVDRHGGRVFSDEIHAPLVFPGHRHLPYASLDEVTAGHTLTATSASKAWNLPGLKCAQLVLSNQADADHWSEVGELGEHGASTLGVVANTAAYTSGGPWLEDVLDYLEGNRALLASLVADRLPGVRATDPEGTYLSLLDCRALDLGESPAAFFAREAGVALTDGARCGEVARGSVRYTFATPRPIIEQTIDLMAGALQRRRGPARA